MGCDCGKRVETPAEKAECEKSAELEAPDQVYEEYICEICHFFDTSTIFN